MNVITLLTLLGSSACLFLFAERLRNLSLIRSKGAFLLLHISGATFSAWVFVQALAFDVVSASDAMGTVFTLAYLWLSRSAWADGAPHYTTRDSLLDQAGPETQVNP